MGTKESEHLREELTEVADIDGVNLIDRDDVSHATAAAEGATETLRRAVKALHHADDPAWRRYAREVEDATLRFDIALGVAAARLRAEHATSPEDLHDAVRMATRSWRARADEARLQTHLGTLDARDAGIHAIDDLDTVSHRVAAILAGLRDDAGASLATMRDRTATAIDELGRALHPHH